MALDFFAGLVGGSAGVVVGHPLDTVKVRIQAQDPKNIIYKGTWRTFKQIFMEEGIKGLYKGINSPLGGMAFINGILFGVYGNMVRTINNYVREHNINMGTFSSHQIVGISGAVAGLAQTVVCSPTELAKIRLQLDPYNKTYTSISDCLTKIFKLYGVRGVYKGFYATVVREVPSYYIYFSVYEYLMMGTSHHTGMMLLSGGLAGTASWTCTYPADIIKTRIQSDGFGTSQKYHGMRHCFKEGLANEGYQFLYRGLNSTIARAFPVNAVTFSVVTWILKLRPLT